MLFDGNAMEGTHGAALKACDSTSAANAERSPRQGGARGFFLGGGISLAYGTHWPDQVAVAIVWYPLTSVLHGPSRLR